MIYRHGRLLLKLSRRACLQPWSMNDQGFVAFYRYSEWRPRCSHLPGVRRHGSEGGGALDYWIGRHTATGFRLAPILGSQLFATAIGEGPDLTDLDAISADGDVIATPLPSYRGQSVVWKTYLWRRSRDSYSKPGSFGAARRGSALFSNQ